ncbi:hypothetical protein HMPREF9148_02199 [Prevotella sp. F0091]|nr:hypothetical protein HMPREF9148_02199 [Prevotella sp. F0091]
MYFGFALPFKAFNIIRQRYLLFCYKANNKFFFLSLLTIE